MIENIRKMVKDKKNKIALEQEELKNRIEEMGSDIDLLNQIGTALEDNEYFMKITPTDAFILLNKLGLDDKKEMLDTYMKLVSDEKTTVVKPLNFSNLNFSTDTVKEQPSNSFENTLKLEQEVQVETPKYSEKYQKYVDKIENPTEEISEENKRLMDSCMQAINESVLSDSRSYFLGDITISKEKSRRKYEKIICR